MFGILKFASYGGDEEKQLARAALVACNLGDDGIGATHLFTWVGRGFDCFEFPRLLAAAGVEAGMEATTELGETALHIAAELPDYQEWDWEDGDEDYPRDSDKHVELMEWLVSKGAVVDAKDNAGNTPLHKAARLGFKKVVARLLALGADPLLRNASGDSSLHMAAEAGCTTMMARFIDSGINVNAKGEKGASALHLASRQGEASCIRMLIDEGGEVHAKCDSDWTPLRHAAAAGNAAALESLLDYGKGDLHQSLPGAGNLLHCAAYRGSTACMQLLVDRGLGVDSVVASTGESVMHKAAHSNQGDTVKWLLDHGASVDVQDHAGRDPLVSAMIAGRDPLGWWSARPVLEEVARSVSGERLLSSVWRGKSLLHLASAYGRGLCVELLIKQGAEVDSTSTDSSKETAMHCAAGNNYHAVVRVLAEASADVDVRDSSGKTALHLAAANDAGLETATLLLNLGASSNIADRSGRTPLMAAARLGHLARCSLLVARGADMTQRDARGQNALSATLSEPRSKNREAVMRLLVDLGCPVGEAEVDAASRGGLTGAFAKAVTARMSGGTSVRQLIKATGRASSEPPTTRLHLGTAPSGGASGPTGSMIAVRVSIEPAPKFTRRCRRVSPTNGVPAATEAPPNEPVSSKVYIVDGLRLRQAVSHLEGAGEVDKCLLLKLLLPTLAAGPRSFRVSSGGGMQATAVHHSLADSAQISCASQTSCPQQATQLLPSVEVSGNGDDFDQAGFEAVMEYLSTGQVAGATCGSIHGDAPAAGKIATSPEVGAHAVACHRAAAYFGLPSLQRIVRAWLEANAVEMEDDGTGVLAETRAYRAESDSDASKKRKLASVTNSS